MNVTDRIVLVSDHIRTEDHIVDGKVTVPGLTNLLTYKGYPFWWALGNPRSTLDSPRVIDSFLNSIIKLRISDDHAPDIVQIRSRIIKAHFPAFFLWFLNSSDFEYFENITSFSQSVINKRCFCYVDEEKSKLERKRWTSRLFFISRVWLNSSLYDSFYKLLWFPKFSLLICETILSKYWNRKGIYEIFFTIQNLLNIHLIPKR